MESVTYFTGTGLETLEEKVRLTLLSSDDPTQHSTQPIGPPDSPLPGLYVVDNFFSRSECQAIVNACETDPGLFQRGVHGSQRHRILCFENNRQVQRRIEERLKSVALPDVRPPGFANPCLFWKTQPKINECLRINQYDQPGAGFDWHRDAPYTTSTNLRSNLSLLLYLSDTIEDCGTEFQELTPDKDAPLIHVGRTVAEEMAWTEQRYPKDQALRTAIVPAVQGRLVVFDQRLLHRGLPLGEPPQNSKMKAKYVLRSDVLCQPVGKSKGTSNDQNEKLPSDPELWIQLMNLTQQIFRQAQYYELQGDYKNASQCYEICTSLRVCPERLASVPSHLEERLLTPLPVDLEVQSLRLIKRNGATFWFQYSTTNGLTTLTTNVFDKEFDRILKVAACTVLATATLKLSPHDSPQIQILLDRILQQAGLSQHVEQAHIVSGDEILQSSICRLPRELREWIVGFIDLDACQKAHRFDWEKDTVNHLIGDKDKYDDPNEIEQSYEGFSNALAEWSNNKYGFTFPAVLSRPGGVEPNIENGETIVQEVSEDDMLAFSIYNPEEYDDSDSVSDDENDHGSEESSTYSDSETIFRMTANTIEDTYRYTAAGSCTFHGQSGYYCNGDGANLELIKGVDYEPGERVFELMHPRKMNEKIKLTTQNVEVTVDKMTATSGTIRLVRVPYSKFNHAAGCIPSHFKWMLGERNRYEKTVFEVDIEMVYEIEEGGVIKIHYTPSIVV